MVAGREVQTCAWLAWLATLDLWSSWGFQAKGLHLADFQHLAWKPSWTYGRSKFLTFWDSQLTCVIRQLLLGGFLQSYDVWSSIIWDTNSIPSGRWCFRSGSSTCFRSSLVAPTGPEAKLFLNRMYWGWWHSAQIGPAHVFGTHQKMLTALFLNATSTFGYKKKYKYEVMEDYVGYSASMFIRYIPGRHFL